MTCFVICDFVSDTMDLTDDESQLMPRPSNMPGMYKMGGFEISPSNGVCIKESSGPEKATPTLFISSCQTAEGGSSSDVDGGSHSSEEELEEINNIPLQLPNPSSCSSSTRSTPPPATPVEFSTTPPNHVHKPRKSTSPPLVHNTRPREELVVTPLFQPSTAEGVALSLEEPRSQETLERRMNSERRAIASKKRYKQSRIHHIQRPCLDFEKMQLVSQNTLILKYIYDEVSTGLLIMPAIKKSIW